MQHSPRKEESWQKKICKYRTSETGKVHKPRGGSRGGTQRQRGSGHTGSAASLFLVFTLKDGESSNWSERGECDQAYV